MNKAKLALFLMIKNGITEKHKDDKTKEEIELLTIDTMAEFMSKINYEEVQRSFRVAKTRHLIKFLEEITG